MEHEVKMMSSRLLLFVVFFGAGLVRAEKSLGNVQSSTLVPSQEKPLAYEYNDGRMPDLNCSHETILVTEYKLLDNGSLLLPQNLMYNHDSYLINNNTAYICVSGELEVMTDERHDLADPQFSKEFLSCGHTLIEPSEYKIFQNGTLFVETYKQYYGPTDYYPQDHGVYICMPNFIEMYTNVTNNNSTDINSAIMKFSDALMYVSHVGLIVSVVSLCLHLFVFCAVSKVRNLPGCCLASLSVALLAAYICFMSTSFAESDDQCAILGMCVYYFFLGSFFWMNAISFDVWRSFRVVIKELRICSHRIPWRRFLVYSVYSWLTPAVLAVLARLADTSDVLPLEYRPSFGVPICWFGQRKALLVFFATPLCFVMLLNAIFFLDSCYVINRATLKSQANDPTLRKRLFMFMRLAFLMGLTWTVGIIAGYVDHDSLWYIFVILNTLQGLFIFVVFSCSSKVRISFLKKLGIDPVSMQGTSVRTISQISSAF